MARFSEEWALEQKLKCDKWRKGKLAYAVDDVADDGEESILQGKIIDWADRHGYPVLCFRQSKKAKGFLVPGWPD